MALVADSIDPITAALKFDCREYSQNHLEAIQPWRLLIDRRLDELLTREGAHGQGCPELAEAMRYSLLGPGKRVRPILCLLTAADFGTDPAPLLDFACALEMVHCASLVLDDLPCMDNARMRRGREATHVRFGEATTTLAAIGLLNQAYGVVASAERLVPVMRAELSRLLSVAVGTAGLVSGQSRDLLERRDGAAEHDIKRINHQKTAVLFELAVRAGGLSANLPEPRSQRLHQFATQVGLAFQTADDLLDCLRHGCGSGKDIGLDRGKA
ncbi:MAG: polyprenyl synthetase family protein, partial [Wenzhouxiangellaceae bacterium]